MPVIAWLLIVPLVLVLAWIGVSYLTRGTPIGAVETVGDGEPPAIESEGFLRMFGLHAKTPLDEGTSAEIFINGDQTYPRLWEDLRSAKHVITLQMYYMQPGRLAEQLREILIERGRAGVQVFFLRDAFGSQKLKEEWFQPICDAGARCESFRPVHWYQLHKSMHRSHIRVAVIDGRIGWTGGFGIDDKWLGDGRSDGHWRDTTVRFTGAAVEHLQAIFADGWAEPTGELLTGHDLFPPPERENDGILAGVVHAAPTQGSTIGERLMAMPISCARRRLWISNSYFVPDHDFVGMMCEAAGRGVDVRILTCNEKGDVKSTWYAGRAKYEELMSAGVRIWEYQPSMMHAKTLVADGRLAIVGTLNFDNRSMAFNDESQFVAYDDGFGRKLEKIFEEDLEFSKEIRLEEFRRRPWRQRLLERFFDLFGRLL